jgi:hypothetical protein
VLCPGSVRAKENDNDQDYLCHGGRSAGFRGRFRDFASRANRAAFDRSSDRRRQSHASLLLLPSSLPPLLVAPRLPALLVMVLYG